MTLYKTTIFHKAGEGSGGGGGGGVTSVNGKTGAVTVSEVPSQSGQSGKFLTTNGTSASWATVSGGLPSQTGNAGKFLTTDGTDASWSDKPLVNSSTNTNALAIGNNTASGSHTTTVGASAWNSLATYGTSVGYNSGVSGMGSVAIGANAHASGAHSILICSDGDSQIYNNDANTFKVANDNGNFEMMSADGSIPSDRLIHAINKYSTMPTAASTNLGWIVQFTGTTDSTYTHGHLYECVSDGQDPATYSWTEVQLGGGGSSYTAGTGIDITSGVISVTEPTLKNGTTSSGAFAIGGTISNNLTTGSIAIGKSSRVSDYCSQAVVCGYQASIYSQQAVAIGSNAAVLANSERGIAIGWGAKASANYAIQFGYGTNTTVGTMSVALSTDGSTWNNYELLSADGTIPAARHASLPATDGTYVLKLVISGGVPTLSWVAE